jgi:hypothetical protein
MKRERCWRAEYAIAFERQAGGALPQELRGFPDWPGSSSLSDHWVTIAANTGITECRMPSRSSVSVGRRRLLQREASISGNRLTNALSSGLTRNYSHSQSAQQFLFAPTFDRLASFVEWYAETAEDCCLALSTQSFDSLLNVWRRNAQTAKGPAVKRLSLCPGDRPAQVRRSSGQFRQTKLAK